MPWRKRFKQSFNQETRLSDLSDKTLYFLSQPGEESAFAFYEFIMAVLGLGPGVNFNWLEMKDQIRVIDIHFFLADQVRFEMMRRLGWVEPLICERYALIEIIQEFNRIKRECESQPPVLVNHHPQRNKYMDLTGRDKEGFIRRLIPDALGAFGKFAIE